MEIGAADIGSEWNSGELVEIVLDDNDMNLDARSQEQMTTGSNTTIVPAVKIGSPITLQHLTPYISNFMADNASVGSSVDC